MNTVIVISREHELVTLENNKSGNLVV